MQSRFADILQMLNLSWRIQQKEEFVNGKQQIHNGTANNIETKRKVHRANEVDEVIGLWNRF